MQKPPIVIESVWPELDGGRHPVKREQGDTVEVWADIFRHGHDILSAVVLFSRADEPWREVPMRLDNNDRWTGAFVVDQPGLYRFTIQAWVEVYDTWRRDTERKQAAGQSIASDLQEGLALLRAAATRARAAERSGAGNGADRELLDKMVSSKPGPPGELSQRLLGDQAVELARRWLDRTAQAAQAERLWLVNCERERARFSAWYEMFPRSQGTDPTRSATFRECENRLPDIHAMGFDVIYMPPIHPIGHSHRKGANNSLVATSSDPGSPYAIGSEAGGHDAVEPSLGTLEDFDHLVAAMRRLGMEPALDFAINCSPDHPYVRQHPEWFHHRPDGSIKYAENPPKRYEDIFPLNFEAPETAAIWSEMRRLLRFWAGHGVRIFRVDNPHTKPMPFWEWLIGQLRTELPDLIFLSEAFTRPKPMKYLAKIGFSQSYTYFTWRNTKAELTEYLEELAHTVTREFFRPNFFVNTPDILTEYLQRGGRPAFIARLVLAATLSPSWGMYSGFELCENRGIPGTEEYQDSEKYQFKVWDWHRPGNIKAQVARLNRIRHEHPALQRIETLRFMNAANPNILFYSKFASAAGDALAIAVNLDPFNAQESPIEFALDHFGWNPEQSFEVRDLLTGDHRGVWRGRNHHLRLETAMPAAIFQLKPL